MTNPTVRAATQNAFGSDGDSVSESAERSADQVPLAWEVGDVILGIYEIKELHEGGGMGVVYRVHHRKWGMDLAVKTPRPSFFRDEAQKERFTRECETWISLGMHPHIASCYYVRRLGGIPRVFAEYVAGGSLRDWIDDRRLYAGGSEKALERILDVGIQMAWGLQHAHHTDLIHRDVKPANVLLDAHGTAKITDFGLAKAIEGLDGPCSSGNDIMVSAAFMTPAYCSPEQAARQRLSPLTDVWSWAVSILEMFVGEVCWRSGIGAPEVLKSLDELEKKDASIPRLPLELRGLLNQCLAFETTARPTNFEIVVEALQRIYHSVIGKEHARRTPELVELQADALNNRAVSFLDLDRAPDSEKLLLDALACDPTHVEATYNYHLLLWRSGRVTDAAVINALEGLGKRSL
jgi:serine/threonine protein kinase